MRKVVIIAFVVLAAALAFAGPGIGISIDSTLHGTGASTNQLGVNTTTIQRRVSGTCASGTAIGTVNSDGTVNCNTAGVTGTGTTGDLAAFTGTGAIGNYGGSSPSACSVGNVLTRATLDATGAVTQTCTAIGTQGGVTGTGTTGDLMSWSSSTGASNYAGSSPSACSAGSSLTQVALGATGALTNTCSTFFNAAGTGLTSTGSTVSANLAGGTCTAGNVATSLSATGALTCTAIGTQGGVSGTGTANTSTKWTGTTAIGNGWALDDGTTWGVSSKFTIDEATGNASAAQVTDTGALLASGVLTVTDTGTQNDYNPSGPPTFATTTVLLFSNASALNITGLAGGSAGRMLWACNVGASQANFLPENAGSTAANRIQALLGQNVSLNGTASGKPSCAQLLYIGGSTNRWIVLYYTSATINGAYTNNGSITFNATTNVQGLQITSNGKVRASDVPPTLSTCGTSPTIHGNDAFFTIVTGTGATACTVTFGTAFSSTLPSCVFTAYGGAALPSMSKAVGSITFGAGTTASTTYDGHCVGTN